MSIDPETHTASPDDPLCPQGLEASILNSLGLAVLVVGSDGRIRYRNAKATDWLPDAPDGDSLLSGAQFLDRFDGFSAVLPRVLDGGETLVFDCALRIAEAGSPVLARLRCMPLHARGTDRISGALLVIEEKENQEAIEEKLEVSKRLSSLGQLAARVAHELNNPLDGILRYVNLAMRLADESVDPRLQSYLTESRVGLMRMVQIIGDLLEFSRATDGEFDEMDFNEVVEQALRNAASAAETSNVIIAADFQSRDMPSVCGSRIYQICCNLIKNAVDAMPHGGRLTVTTGVVDGEVVIRVTDTGVGLPEPIDQVFEAFFTTKQPGKGTGLGLAICKDFLEEMQGSISAVNGEGGGAVFTVRIPLSAFRKASPLSVPPPDRTAGVSSKARP